MKQEKLEQKLEAAKQHAQKQGGNCLSTEYINNGSPMSWSCSNPEHKEWNATYKKVVCCGTWCPQCSREVARIKMQSQKLSAEQRLVIAHNHAKAKGGTCLTEQPAHAKQPLTWKCGNDEHKPWQAIHDAVVKLGSWCPDCGITQRGQSRINTNALEIAKEYAINHGGQCLSTQYMKARDYLVWKCNNKEHKPWESWYDTVIRQGTWCPQCAAENNISESRVRAIFEVFFGKPFPTVRPAWNVNPWTYQLLELDGYCAEFNIAFEHDGEHHNELVGYFGKTQLNELTYQKFKDHQKRKNCLRQGIFLVNIPIVNRNKVHDFNAVLNNVIESCKKRGFDMSFTEKQLQQIKEKF